MTAPAPMTREGERATDWLPMETAPRDGTKVALAAWCSYNDRWVFGVDYWRPFLLGHSEGFSLHTIGDRWPSGWMPLPSRKEEADHGLSRVRPAAPAVSPREG